MKKGKKMTIVFVILLIIIAVAVIGYAILQTTLNILGDTSVKGNTWNIHWANIHVSNGSTTGNTQEATIINPTQVKFNVTLNEPGDYYEFTVDAVNEGTIDGMIDVISTNVYQSNGTTPTTLPSAITYSITYDNGLDLERYQLLSANSSEKYKVRVEYRRNITNSELITTNQTYVVKVGITYIQADENAISSIPGVLPVYNASDGCANITTDSSGGGGNATMSGLTLMMKEATQGEDNPSWFTNTATSQSQAGVYTRKGTSNDKYPIYYYRGEKDSVNNNLIFNNYCWKIVRTTPTGGVRIIYNGPPNNGQCIPQGSTTTHISETTFNPGFQDKKYLKYVYDNNGTPTDSTLKQTLESWYNTNMNRVDTLIEKSMYCNDTTEISAAEISELNPFESGDYYCPYKRTYNGTPTTLCSRKSDAYISKVGFLTVDEMMLAGRTWNTGMPDYLYNGNLYWLGSPKMFIEGSHAYMFYAYDQQRLNVGRYTDYTAGVRPVITLSPNTLYIGTGTKTNPFVVQETG